jgi:steroid delta-isomerase-like uncharacterized protein
MYSQRSWWRSGSRRTYQGDLRAPTGTAADARGVPTRSVLSCRAFFRKTFAAFPDFEIAVDRIVADATSAAVQWHATGTFTGGPFQGILATGRRVKLRGVDVMEVADGLIQHNTIYYDGASLARQIGKLPFQGSRADRALVFVFNSKSRLSRRRR